MYIKEKFTLDGYYLIYSKILKNPQLVKADSRSEAEDIFNEYWQHDIDYMCGGRDNITGSVLANVNEIAQYITDGYLCREE